MAKQTFSVGQVLTAAQMTSLQQTAMGGGSATAKTSSYVLVAADAGTVVSVNSTSATTITVNTGLFAAGDTVFIQNWGSGSVTITAGTATVNTHGSLVLAQYEGGTLYFTSSSAAIFFDISQTSGMTNPMTTTGDMIYSSSGSTPARLGIGSTGQVLTVSSGLPSWATPAGGSITSATAATLTEQTTTSTSFTDLATTTSVTLTTGTKALVILACQLWNSGFNYSYMGFAISGATTQSASDGASMIYVNPSAGYVGQFSYAYTATGLTAGSNTFTLKFRTNSGTGSFFNRRITVIDMGS